MDVKGYIAYILSSVQKNLVTSPVVQRLAQETLDL